jgi:hypothetical protein
LRLVDGKMPDGGKLPFGRYERPGRQIECVAMPAEGKEAIVHYF